MAGVHRGARGGSREELPGRESVSRGNSTVGRRVDARRRHVRVQLRRLGVFDAFLGADYASVRRGTIDRSQFTADQSQLTPKLLVASESFLERTIVATRQPACVRRTT